MATSALLSMIHPAAAKTAAPMATTGTSGTSSSSSSSSSSDSATITANDFLTLLVTEMQNQDPTADTDPNEYINQLVQVNSLQQLISINQVLTDSLGGSTDTSSTGDGTAPDSTQASTTHAATTAQTLSLGNNASSGAQPIAQIAGNLGIPEASASSFGIAHALDGTKRTVPPQFAALPR